MSSVNVPNPPSLLVHPVGMDGKPISAKENYAYVSKAIIHRPTALTVDGQFVNQFTPPGAFFHKEGPHTFKCSKYSACKAKIRLSRPLHGQGDEYMVLQTKGCHHTACPLYDAQAKGEVTFRQSEMCFVLP